MFCAGRGRVGQPRNDRRGGRRGRRRGSRSPPSLWRGSSWWCWTRWEHCTSVTSFFLRLLSNQANQIICPQVGEVELDKESVLLSAEKVEKPKDKPERKDSKSDREREKDKSRRRSSAKHEKKV